MMCLITVNPYMSEDSHRNIFEYIGSNKSLDVRVSLDKTIEGSAIRLRTISSREKFAWYDQKI